MIRLYHSAYNRYNIEHKELQANCIQGITVIFLKGCFRKGNLIAQVRQPEMQRCTPTDVILNFLMRLSCNSILKEWDFTTGLPLYLLPSWRSRGRNVYCCLHDRHALKKTKQSLVSREFAVLAMKLPRAWVPKEPSRFIFFRDAITWNVSDTISAFKK